MTPDQFREIIREEIRPVIREELEPIHERLDGLEKAVLVLADHAPGSFPGQPSYVRTKVEAAFAEAAR